MTTLKIKQSDGTWEKAITLGSFDAAKRAETAATTAQNAASASQAARDKIVSDGYNVAFKTVAEMKAANLTNGMVVKTAGYYSANDGGDALYVIKENSTLFFETLNNNLVAELIINNGVVFIKQLGVNNTANDKAKIQKAIDIGVSEIIFNADVLLSEPISLTAGIVVRGIPSYTVTASGNYAFTFYTTGSSSAESPKFYNLNFVLSNGGICINNTALPVSDEGDYQKYVMRPVIEGCDFYNQGTVGNNIVLTKCFDTVISGNRITQGNRGIKLYGCDITSIENNRIWKSKVLIENTFVTNFGSHTIIKGNDLLVPQNETIITSGVHTIIKDNYIEDYTQKDTCIVASGSVYQYMFELSNNKFDLRNTKNYLVTLSGEFSSIIVENNSGNYNLPPINYSNLNMCAVNKLSSSEVQKKVLCVRNNKGISDVTTNYTDISSLFYVGQNDLSRLATTNSVEQLYFNSNNILTFTGIGTSYNLVCFNNDTSELQYTVKLLVKTNGATNGKLLIQFRDANDTSLATVNLTDISNSWKVYTLATSLSFSKMVIGASQVDTASDASKKILVKAVWGEI